jgi:hypothetical protein
VEVRLAMQRFLRVLLPTLVASALLAPVAQADHNADEHSKNMTHVALSQNFDTVNTDLAFWGDLVFAGDFGGFRIIDASDPSDPVVLSDVRCNGPQNDVAVWDNLLIMSIDRPQVSDECSEDTPPRTVGWEGLRIFDVSDPTDPFLLTAVATDCGSHTHTLIPDLDNNRILAYVSSSFSAAFEGPTPFGTTCESPHDKISVVEVPLDDPASASVVATPALTGASACHDIGVFTALNLAAAACRPQAQIWDISDPLNPVLLRGTENPAVPGWHSGAFTYDGEIAIFSHEGPRTSCEDPLDDVGRIWFYRVSDLELLGSFKIPRPQPGRICTSHNYNLVPVFNRYILVSSWYEGGTSVVDFTNPRNPREIAFYAPRENPFDPSIPGSTEAWSSYWYNGLIYSNDGANDRKPNLDVRGVDIFALKHSATKKALTFDYHNPQTQEVFIPRKGPPPG